MSLQFLLSDKNVRVWSAAITSLARIGKTISLEWRDGEIVLRTLTDTQSAFAAFHFSTPFFDSLSSPSSLAPDDAREMTKTRFSAKVLAAAAKNPRGVTKLHAYFARQESCHVFVLRAELKNGFVRTHTITFEEAAILQPLYRREEAPFQLAARPSLIHTVLDRMHGTEEMSILASPRVIQFQSYHDAAATDAPTTVRGALHTALAYAVTEFEGVLLNHAAAGENIVVPAGGDGDPLVAVTFNIKELKNVLAFAETSVVNAEELAIFFHCPGQPILFSTHTAKALPFRVDLVLATLEIPVMPAPSSTLAGAFTAGGVGGAGGAGVGGGDAAGAGANTADGAHHAMHEEDAPPQREQLPATVSRKRAQEEAAPQDDVPIDPVDSLRRRLQEGRKKV